jgi:hypothetical protein
LRRRIVERANNSVSLWRAVRSTVVEKSTVN